MHKTFVQAFAFNASAAFLYKITLLAHQIFLYTVIPHHMYGKQSSLFAALYLCIALTNFGFDETLLPFFSRYNQNKAQSKQLFAHFFLHTTTIAVIATLLYITFMYSSAAFLHNLQGYCNENLILVMALLFFIENSKKSLIAMMQLAFLNKQIAYAQIYSLITYLTCFWALYTIQGHATLPMIFIPMLATSIIESMYLFYIFTQFYDRLPDGQETQASNIPFKVLFVQRMLNYINQIAKVFYSPNSMTLCFAYMLGFTQAATIKFFTNIITLSYTCIAKSVGVTSGAIFSSATSIQASSLFKDITHRYFQFLSILSCVMGVIISYAYYTSMITQSMAWQILLFFTISFLEHVAITYEQLLMSKGKAWILTCIHTGGFTLLSLSLYRYSHSLMYWHMLIFVFIIIKLCSLFLLSHIVRKQINKAQ